MEVTAPQVTQLLRAWRAGDGAAFDELMPIVYSQLRSIAARYMRQERVDHTLRSTALVNEAHLRLLEIDVSWQDRAHFTAIAALTMRRILVDHAKSLHRVKRGSGAVKLQLDESLGDAVEVAQADPAQMIDLDNALTLLERQDARKARLIELIYFGGLSGEEAAEVLGISVPTVNRDLKLAKAWLRRRLQHGQETSP
jgi:RNA polymerase sigma factor (TIGR02999 family)